jgi:hypothetical protein
MAHLVLQEQVVRDAREQLQHACRAPVAQEEPGVLLAEQPRGVVCRRLALLQRG